MSIEKLIADHTAALTANTAALVALTEAWGKLRDRAVELRETGASAATVAAAGVPMADAPKAEKPGKAEKAERPAATQPAAAPAPTETAAPEAAAASPSETVYTREDLVKAISTYAKTHREDVVGILQSFGAKKGSEVKDADVHAAAAQILALGAEDDLA